MSTAERPRPAASPSAPYVFVSYASRDRDRVLPVVEALMEEGIGIWFDQDAIPGFSLYGEHIAAGIEGCAGVLLACSVAAFDSKNVRREISLAGSNARPLLPLMLEQAAIPLDLRYALAGWQRIDALDRPPETWLPAVLGAIRHLVNDDGLADAAPELDPVAEAPSRSSMTLPIATSRLIGRAAERAAVRDLLGRPDVRLVTLTGPGGTGKTRLALQVAADARASFPDRVALVDLSPVTDSELALPTIAQVLGVSEEGGQPLHDLLVAFLAQKSVLLVLDNCERLLAAAPAMAAVVTACPQLKIIATSRAPLRLQGEWEFPVSPLPAPDPARLPPLADLAQVDAVALFVERAQAATPTFALTAENAAAVAGICHRLEGLPLAIEFAAARVKSLGPPAILARLGRRLDLLTDGKADAPDRHKTLRAAIAWSHDLLAPHERELFRRLVVVPGGCTIETADAVGRGGEEASGRAERTSLLDSSTPRLLASSVLDCLAILVDQSLLRKEDGPDGEPRFTMLETVREFGLEQLDENGEVDATRRACAAHFLALAERAEPHLSGPEQLLWLGRLEVEHDNFRAALEWLTEHEDAERGLCLAIALWRFWNVRGHFTEGRRWLTSALDGAAAASPETRATALLAKGVLVRNQGDYARAEWLAEQALAQFEHLDNQRGIAQALDDLAAAAQERGDRGRAIALGEQSLALFRQENDRHGVASVLTNLGIVALEAGEYQRADGCFREGLALYQQAQDVRCVASTLGNLGMVAYGQGDYAAAETFFRQALGVQRELRNKRGVALSLGNLATLLAEGERDLDDATALGQESLDLYEEIGDRQGIASSLQTLAAVAHAQGDPRRALALYDRSLALYQELSDRGGEAEANAGLALAASDVGDRRRGVEAGRRGLTLYRDLGDPVGIARCLEALADIARHQEPETAIRFIAAAAAIREDLGAPPTPTEVARRDLGLAIARAQLGDNAFTTARSTGGWVPYDVVVEEALRMT